VPLAVCIGAIAQAVSTHTTQHSNPDSSDGVVTRLWTGRCKF
jgi:hypothetical protein